MQNYKKGMENLGDYLYLILIGIAVIASFIKPKKKASPSAPSNPMQTEEREQQQIPAYNTGKTPPPIPERKPKTWQELLQSLNEAQPAQQRSTSVSQKRETKGLTSSHFSAENRKGKRASTISSITERIQRFSDHDQLLGQTESSIDIDFSNIDEIKKGIIYAEIFNRKY
ncbi:MAG: hypothetical protein LUG18_11750 [Candidatus Azobacteroides sp.]|nr:hypothetical protein [Candidatus Azobacteroides sp.]